ncbi:MAG: lipopolysaccharide biosynthesis protein [Candidatus Omnitrophota bacterium]
MNANKHNLKQQASNGAFWGLSGNLTVSAISFVGTAILARILSPKDFGLLGMATLITGIVQLFGNLGLGAALVYKKDVDDEYLSTAFWSSLLVSAGLVLVSIAVAPLAAIFFNEPTVKWIIIVLSANFIISSLSSVQRALLHKDVKIKRMVFIEIVSRFLRVIFMLVCALTGLGFWSIVIGIIAECILKTILYVLTTQWIPTFQFHKMRFNELFHYGKNIYGQEFLNYLNRSMDFIITGRVLGAKLLGFYQFSYNLPYLVKSYIQDGISPVAFSIFSKVQDDNKRLAGGFLNAVKYVSIITFPVMSGLAFCAEDFISVAYGSKWLPAAEPLKLLCFGSALASVHCLVYSLFNAKGRPDIGLKWGLLILPTTIISVVLFSRWGIIGVAWAMFCMEVLTIAVAYIATKLLNTSFKSYFKALLPAIYGSLAIIIALYFITHKILVIPNIYFRFASNILLGAITYVVFLFIFYRKDLINTLDFISLGMRK